MLADLLRAARVLVDRGPDAVRVPVAELADSLGTPMIDLQFFGVRADPDDTVSLREAGAIAERFESDRVAQRKLWADYLAACREWADGRSATAAAAAVRGSDEAATDGRSAAQIRTEARKAATEAAREYERTVPRPTFNGEAAHGFAELLYVNESEAARPGGAS